VIEGYLTAKAVTKEDTFHAGVAVACGSTGRIAELAAYLTGGDPNTVHAPDEIDAADKPEPFLRRILQTPGEHVEVAMTPDGQYDLAAFFDDEE